MPGNHIIGNVGLYYTCYQLSRRGWNVMPTARNARGIDIVAYNSGGSCFKGIQVKSLRKRNSVPMGRGLENIMGDFWVIVNDVLEKPNSFVMLPSEVKENVHRGGRDGRVSYWLEPRCSRPFQSSLELPIKSHCGGSIAAIWGIPLMQYVYFLEDMLLSIRAEALPIRPLL